MNTAFLSTCKGSTRPFSVPEPASPTRRAQHAEGAPSPHPPSAMLTPSGYRLRPQQCYEDVTYRTPLQYIPDVRRVNACGAHCPQSLHLPHHAASQFFFTSHVLNSYVRLVTSLEFPPILLTCVPSTFILHSEWCSSFVAISIPRSAHGDSVGVQRRRTLGMCCRSI